MTGVLMFWRWKQEIEDPEGHADITEANIVGNAIWLQSGPRRPCTTVRRTEYTGLSRDATEYLSRWAAHPTFHPRGERFSERGCVVQWLPGFKLPPSVHPSGKQSSYPVLEGSLLCRLMESSLACACLYTIALDTELTSNCETLEDVRALLLNLRNSLGGGGYWTDTLHIPATSDVQVQISETLENTVEALITSLEVAERWAMEGADIQSVLFLRQGEDTSPSSSSSSSSVQSSSSNLVDEKKNDGAVRADTNTPKGSARGVCRTSQVGLLEPAPKRVPPPPPSLPRRPPEVSDSNMRANDGRGCVPVVPVIVPPLTRASRPRVAPPPFILELRQRVVPPPRRMPPPPPRPRG
jgi:hypothetical protein